MTTDSLSHLSKPELLGVLEFIFASQKFTERDLFYKSLRTLGRNVLHCDHLVIGTCSSSVRSDLEKNTRCQGFDSLVTLETVVHEGTKHLIDKRDSVLRACTTHTSNCSNNCSSNSFDKNLEEQEEVPDVKVTLVCNKNGLTSQPLCLASIGNSIKTFGNISESNFEIIQSLIPYVTDAFFRLEPQSLAPPCQNPTSATPPSVRSDIFMTPREREILNWTSQGKSCWETGSILGISERTVKFHLQNIYRKLNVVNRAQAITKAMQYALL